MLKDLGEHPEIKVSEEDWLALEQAGGVTLTYPSRQSIEEGLARWIRVKSPGWHSDTVRVPNKSVRGHLKKVQTCINRLLKAFASSEELATACGENFTRDIAGKGAAWGQQCGCFGWPSSCFVLRGYYWDDLLHYLTGLQTALQEVATGRTIRGRNQRWLDQQVKDAGQLRSLLEMSKGAKEFSATTGSAVVVIGSGVDPARDAVIHCIYFHMRSVLSTKHCSQKNPAVLLNYLMSVCDTVNEEVQGGERRRRSDTQFPALISQCGYVYSNSGGRIRLYFSKDDKIFADLDDEEFDECAQNNSSKFILFICALNEIVKNAGFPLRETPKAIADATWKVYRGHT